MKADIQIRIVYVSRPSKAATVLHLLFTTLRIVLNVNADALGLIIKWGKCGARCVRVNK